MQKYTYFSCFTNAYTPFKLQIIGDLITFVFTPAWTAPNPDVFSFASRFAKV